MSNTWKLLGDERLPPVITDFWSYEADSWAWKPVQYNNARPVDTPVTLSYDYWDYINAEKTIPYPLITMRGGLSDVDISALEDATLRYPDIKSETVRSSSILNNYWQQVSHMLPTKVVY